MAASRLRLAVCLLTGVGVAQAADLPAWWTAFAQLSRLESSFTQESESAVFGKLKREGKLQLAKGGRLRVTYAKGMLLVADGTTLVQYDPMASTAQRLDLRTARKDMPLLNILLDPTALEDSYEIRAEQGERVLLEPRRKELPPVLLEGKGRILGRVTWTDGTGAKQVLELKHPRTPGSAFPASTFTFKAPAGTRWIR